MIDTWVRAGGILISTNDAADRDALSTLFGVPAIARSGTTWVPANAVHPVVNGPFGTWSSVGTVGLFSHFNPMDDWNTIASDTNGRATIIERTVGQGHVIITGDEGVLMRNTSANNRVMSLNLFAYAIDMLPKLAGDVDEDRLENQLDLDSDNDGIPDVIEAGGIDANNDGMIDDPFNNQGTLSSLPDSDNDGLFDFLDADDNPVFPNPINDSDNDGWEDSVDGSIGGDFDNDGVADGNDPDDDNDGVDDINDAFPRDPDESRDTDGDRIGNNADTDDDGDGVIDTADAFPLDASEVADQDNDGIGDNADLDDNNDGIPDEPPMPDDTISNNARGITLDGNLNDWATYIGFKTDPDDITGADNPLDWLQAWMAHDQDNFYLAYRNDGTVNPSWGQSVYIDTDSSMGTSYSEGLAIGADYVAQAQYLYRYTGDGSSWEWAFVTELASGFSDDSSELRIVRQDIGAPDAVRLAFVGSNAAYTNGTASDFYPDGVYNTAASVRYLEYTATASGNSAPLAMNQRVVVTQNQSRAITLSGSDADNDPLAFSIATAPVNGTLTGTAPSLSYTPAADFIGEDSFSFNVTDGVLASGIATVTLSVQSDGEQQIPSNRATDLTVDGNLADWASFRSFGVDPDDITGSENPIDWREGWVAHDEQNLYFAYRNDDGDIGAIDGWGFNLFIDTDRDAGTGYDGGYSIGADYLLQGNSLYSHSGGQPTDWAWIFVANAVSASSANMIEMGISRQVLGDPDQFDILYLADNPSIGGNSEDQYPDGVYDPADDTRYFSYSVNGLPSVEINPLLSEASPTVGEPLSGRKDVFDNAHPLGIEVSGNTTTTSGNTQSASTQSESSSGALGFGWLVAGLSMLGYRRACKKTVTRM